MGLDEGIVGFVIFYSNPIHRIDKTYVFLGIVYPMGEGLFLNS